MKLRTVKLTFCQVCCYYICFRLSQVYENIGVVSAELSRLFGCLTAPYSSTNVNIHLSLALIDDLCLKAS